MYSVYEKTVGNAKWTAVYEPDKGVYQKYKSGKPVNTNITPEQFKGHVGLGIGYAPAKNAVLGTGATSTPATSVSTTPKVQSEFTYKGSGTQLGGAHDKYIFTDKAGSEWMFKPAQTLGGQPDKLKALRIK